MWFLLPAGAVRRFAWFLSRVQTDFPYKTAFRSSLNLLYGVVAEKKRSLAGSTLGRCWHLIALCSCLLWASPAWPQQPESSETTTASEEAGVQADSATTDESAEKLPEVIVETDIEEPDTTDDADEVAEDDTPALAPTSSKPRQTQVTQQAPPAAASAAAASDVNGAGESQRQANVDGALGTGPTGVDGYVASATSTFTKTNTPIQNIPQTISVVTKQQAQDQGHETLGQVLQYVPGVAVQQGEGHRDQVTIRGQETTADFYTDGVRDDIQYFRDLYNIEAVEVLKGPAALIFGRGGGGGIVNRVTKKAEWRDVREASINFGMFDRKRVTMDVGQAVNDAVAVRLNVMYEQSESFRDFFDLERYGFNPTIAIKLAPRTKLQASYQYHYDDRTVDRGVPSRNGFPIEGFQDIYFGNPNVSFSEFEGHVATATLDHEFQPGLNFRQHVSYNRYDKFYQNIFPGSSVDPATGNFGVGAVAGDDDAGGYNNGTDRQSFFSQTDVSYRFNTGALMRHTLLAGAEFTWQDQRNTRYVPFFPGAGAGGITLNIANPTSFAPVVFNTLTRDRSTTLKTQSGYIQDQIEITDYFELIAGIRYDRFDLDFQDNRPGQGNPLNRVDGEWSPRLGVVVKPTSNLSFYASWSRSFLPSAGDQFDNLSGRDDLEPEQFENREVGVKWSLLPRLQLAAALFQLDRTNRPVTVNATTVAAGESETRGGEISIAGYVTDQWQINLGYSNIRSEITNNGDDLSLVGNSVESTPRHLFSLWNRYQFTHWFGAGIGVLHSDDYFAATSNTVVVPSYTRVDAALFLNLNENWSAQLNVENIFDTDYFAAAHNNNNISPGAPRSAYVTVRAKF
jgi:catecholate siderophore receptor